MQKVRTVRVLLLLVVPAYLTGCCCTSDPVRATSRPAIAQASTLPAPADGRVAGVENFGMVTADIWRGAKPTREGFQSLAAMKVKTVIDLQEEDQSANIPAGVRYVPIRISGWKADQVDTAAVLKAIGDNPKPVFIHCREGRDRTGLVVAAYRLECGIPTADAIAELNRYHVNFWWRGPIERRIRQLAAARAASRPSTTPASTRP